MYKNLPISALGQTNASRPAHVWLIATVFHLPTPFAITGPSNKTLPGEPE